MAQVIAAIQQKGGVGKSTLLCALALVLARAGEKVLVVDTDRQHTCMDFHDLSDPGFDVYAETNEDNVTEVVDRLKPKYDVILIDSAGIDSQMIVYVAAAADLVLIPSGASRPDAAGAIRTWKKIKQVQAISGRPKAVQVVLMNHNPAARVTANVSEAYRAAEAPLYKAGLPSLTGFKEMHTTGQLPEGAAARHLDEFIQALRADKLLGGRRGKAKAA